MIDLIEYIIEENQINEGLLKNMMSRPILNRMSSEDLKTGILNMYDYICAGDDIEKFYKDFPRIQKMFWKNLYELYDSTAFGMFEIDPKLGGVPTKSDDEGENKNENPTHRHGGATTIEDIASEDELVKITPELRRMLRDVMDNSKISKNSKITAADPVFLFITSDPLYEDEYRMMFTINKAANMFSKRFLEALFKKIDEQ